MSLILFMTFEQTWDAYVFSGKEQLGDSDI